MKLQSLLPAVLATCLLACPPLRAADPAPAVAAPGGWELVWQDEFDRPGAPDPAKWSYNVGGDGWGNNEQQCRSA